MNNKILLLAGIVFGIIFLASSTLAAPYVNFTNIGLAGKAINQSTIVTGDMFAKDSNITISGIDFNCDTNYIFKLVNYAGTARDINIMGADFNSTDWGYVNTNDTNHGMRGDFNVFDGNNLYGQNGNIIAHDFNVRWDVNYMPDDWNTDFNGFKGVKVKTGNCVLGTGNNRFAADKNFDVNLHIPTSATSGMNFIQVYYTDSNAALGRAASTGPFYITPFIVIHINKTAKSFNMDGYQPFGPIDSNVHIRGYGFYKDENISFTITRSGLAYNDASAIDLNIAFDGNGDVYRGDKARVDLNLLTGKYVVIDKNSFVDKNGLGIGMQSHGDKNYTFSFDINFRVPVSLSPMANPYQIHAYSTLQGDINVGFAMTGADNSALFYATPSANMTTDQNVTVGVCDRNRTCYYNESGVDGNYQRTKIDNAMRLGYINNQQAVKGFVIEMKNGGTFDNNYTLTMRISMNNDINMLNGPGGPGRNDYNSNMTSGAGKAKIDTDQMPGFKVDANVVFFHVPSKSGAIPKIAKDGIVCPASICTIQSWAWNSGNQLDGNLFFRVLTFSEYSTVNLDMNIAAPTLKNYLNIANTSTNIDFNWSDTNTDQNRLTVKIYWSDTNGAFTNLITTKRILDNNALVVDGNTVADGNLNCTKNPTSTDKTNNCIYTWNMSGVPDGNHYIDINLIVDDNRGNSQPDKNFFATSGSTFVVDKHAPATPSITAPTSNPVAVYGAGTTSITVTYSSSDTNVGINNYDTQVASTSGCSGSWTNRASVTSFSQTVEAGVWYLCVRATDKAGNISTVASRIFTVESSSASSGGGGGGGGGGTPSSERIIHKVSEGKPTAEDITNLLTSAGASQTAIEKASAAVGKTTVSREVNVEKITTNGVVTYKSTITFTVSNPNTLKVLQKVKVLVEVPKSVALKASDLNIPAGVKYRVVKDDPILEFEINEISAGGSATVSYIVNKYLSETLADSIKPAVVAEFQEAEPPAPQPTSTTTPGTTPGEGTGGEEGTTPPATETPAGQGTGGASNDLLRNAAIVIVIVIIIVAAYFVMGKKGKKNKLSYK